MIAQDYSIKFKDIDIDYAIENDIKDIGNSCGVITIYLLSLLYGFEFDINDFRNIGDGLTHVQMQDYINKKGVFTFCPVYGQLSFGDYSEMLDNGITLNISAEFFGKERVPHNTLIYNIKDNQYHCCYARENIIDCDKIGDGLSFLFVSNQDNIKGFVEFSPSNQLVC